MLQKLKIILVIFVGWVIVTSLYAYYYVVTILALPEEYDAYARNWSFQLLMFAIFRLPYMLTTLSIVILVVIARPPRKQELN